MSTVTAKERLALATDGRWETYAHCPFCRWCHDTEGYVHGESARCDGCGRDFTSEQAIRSSICRDRGYHDDQEFIDPRSGGFVRCRDCGRDMDCEEDEDW